ncbi:cupin domain-containing protein [Ktedonospora formicarum]|uniref:Cupin domain-containing protein n=1 Tax=Ktedonospora formicarum TaxID=2778364 RepID=A0A8J3HW07_9CHLR|nr:hypothetical protein [Ktedonospora formicarum]GHO42030.1 hypothetical protein KSX_01930 [Ktedonospora formicarum]
MAEDGLLIPKWKDEEATPVTIVAPEERKAVILTGAQTKNMISMISFTNTPGNFNALHYHTREDEIWHIIDGEWEFQVNGKVHRGKAMGETPCLGHAISPIAFEMQEIQ